MKLSSLVRGLPLVAVLMPSFFMIEHVGSEGFPEALACSGSGPVSMPTARVVRTALDQTSVEVNADALFLFDVTTYNAPATVTVEVTTDAGSPVPGSSKPLKEYAVGWNEQVRYGWAASSPLELGTKLKAKVGATADGAKDEITLDVVLARPALDIGTWSIDHWYDFRHGTGPLVQCNSTQGASCINPRMIDVHSAEEKLVAASYAWAPPASLKGVVAWELRAERTTALPNQEELKPSEGVLFQGAPDQDYGGGLVPFAIGDGDHCAKLIVTDLWSGEEVSKELCAPAGTVSDTITDDQWQACDSPPSAALTDTWCKAHPASTLQVCTQGTGAPNEPSQPQAGSGNIADSPRPESSSSSSSSSGSSSSSSCQLSGAVSRHGAFGMLVVASALAGVLRRRRAVR